MTHFGCLCKRKDFSSGGKCDSIEVKGEIVMVIRNAEFDDMKRLGHIMSVSFRTAFSDFVTKQTLDACAQEDNCVVLLEGIYQEGKMHFLMGENSGMLVWQKVRNSAEIVAIHSLPDSWGTGLGHAMLEEALNQIGNQPVFLWAFKENKRARRFYEKHGFRWDGSERVSEFDGALEVRYVKG
jgi:ribosomal protein S18 acetylase RimI-like enzyme